mmetsp:Transcript_2514/g.4792  ORF Transcript_2514/g.4792 Transcript_2514/m.4792 type:complete len:380 (-) Transcript_2514:70-1209(-)
MSIRARQLSSVFADILPHNEVESVCVQQKGNVERCFDVLIRRIPRDKRTQEICDKLWRRLKQYWRVRTDGLAIQETCSNSITVSSVGSLRRHEYVRAHTTMETKLGKLWIKHSRGWSVATRKGEVHMKRAIKPAALIDAERQIREKKEAAIVRERRSSRSRTKSKEDTLERTDSPARRKKTSRKAKKTKKIPHSAEAKTKKANAPADPFADDPFKKAAMDSAKPTAQTAPTAELLFSRYSDPFAQAAQKASPNILNEAFAKATTVPQPQSEPSIDFLTEELKRAGTIEQPAPEISPMDGFNQSSKKGEKETKWVPAGDNILNFADFTKSPDKPPAPKKKTLADLRSENIDLANPAPMQQPMYQPAVRPDTVDAFFSPQI